MGNDGPKWNDRERGGGIQWNDGERGGGISGGVGNDGKRGRDKWNDLSL